MIQRFSIVIALMCALLSAALFLGTPNVTAGPENVPPPSVEVDPHVSSPEQLDASPFHVYKLPVGTPLAIVLQSPIGTAINQVNDPIEAAVTQDFYIGANIMISKNARLRGRVSVVELPIQGRNALMGITFHELTLRNGERVPIESYIKTERDDHLWGGQLTPGTEFKRVTHRVLGIGTYNKTVLAGERQMGQHVQFAPGERMTLILTRPITVVVPK